MRMRMGSVVFLVVLLAGCVLPGRSGWECDDERDCHTGHECRSVHGDRGYTTICLRPDETIFIGTKGNWILFAMWPLVGLGVAVGLASRFLAHRRRR